MQGAWPRDRVGGTTRGRGVDRVWRRRGCCKGAGLNEGVVNEWA